MELFEQGQRLTELHNEQALAKHRATQHTEAQRHSDGVLVCCDCELPIPAARLAAKPTAVRCIDCQTIKERCYGV